MPVPEAVKELPEKLLVSRGKRRLVDQDELHRSGLAGVGGHGFEQVARADGVVSGFAQLRPEQRASPVHRHHDEDTGRRHPLMMVSPFRRGNGSRVMTTRTARFAGAILRALAV